MDSARSANPLNDHTNNCAQDFINCDKCPAVFISLGRFNRHRKTHTKPHMCNNCGKCFALRNDLIRHNAMHQSFDTLFYCNFPGCKFKGTPRKDNLRRHMRMSHREKTSPGKGLQEEDINMSCNKAQLERKQLIEASTLLAAAQLGDELALRIMIASGTDISITSKQGKTALHIAASEGHIHCVRILLIAGAEPLAQNKLGHTALHISALKGHVAVTQILLLGIVDIGVKSYEGQTALQLAISKGHEHVAKLLLQKGADLNAKTSDG